MIEVLDVFDKNPSPNYYFVLVYNIYTYISVPVCSYIGYNIGAALNKSFLIK